MLLTPWCLWIKRHKEYVSGRALLSVRAQVCRGELLGGPLLRHHRLRSPEPGQMTGVAHLDLRCGSSAMGPRLIILQMSPWLMERVTVAATAAPAMWPIFPLFFLPGATA